MPAVLTKLETDLIDRAIDEHFSAQKFSIEEQKPKISEVICRYMARERELFPEGDFTLDRLKGLVASLCSPQTAAMGEYVDWAISTKKVAADGGLERLFNRHGRLYDAKEGVVELARSQLQIKGGTPAKRFPEQHKLAVSHLKDSDATNKVMPALLIEHYQQLGQVFEGVESREELEGRLAKWFAKAINLGTLYLDYILVNNSKLSQELVVRAKDNYPRKDGRPYTEARVVAEILTSLNMAVSSAVRPPNTLAGNLLGDSVYGLAGEFCAAHILNSVEKCVTEPEPGHFGIVEKLAQILRNIEPDVKDSNPIQEAKTTIRTRLYGRFQYVIPILLASRIFNSKNAVEIDQKIILLSKVLRPVEYRLIFQPGDMKFIDIKSLIMRWSSDKTLEPAIYLNTLRAILSIRSPEESQEIFSGMSLIGLLPLIKYWGADQGSPDYVFYQKARQELSLRIEKSLHDYLAGKGIKAPYKPEDFELPDAKLSLMQRGERNIRYAYEILELLNGLKKVPAAQYQQAYNLVMKRIDAIKQKTEIRGKRVLGRQSSDLAEVLSSITLPYDQKQTGHLPAEMKDNIDSINKMSAEHDRARGHWMSYLGKRIWNWVAQNPYAALFAALVLAVAIMAIVLTGGFGAIPAVVGTVASLGLSGPASTGIIVTALAVGVISAEVMLNARHTADARIRRALGEENKLQVEAVPPVSAQAPAPVVLVPLAALTASRLGSDPGSLADSQVRMVLDGSEPASISRTSEGTAGGETGLPLGDPSSLVQTQVSGQAAPGVPLSLDEGLVMGGAGDLAESPEFRPGSKLMVSTAARRSTPDAATVPEKLPGSTVRGRAHSGDLPQNTGSMSGRGIADATLRGGVNLPPMAPAPSAEVTCLSRGRSVSSPSGPSKQHVPQPEVLSEVPAVGLRPS